MSLDPKRVTESDWQKQQSRTGKRSVDAVNDRRHQGRGSDGMMLKMLLEKEETGGLLLLRGGNCKIRTPENRKR